MDRSALQLIINGLGSRGRSSVGHRTRIVVILWDRRVRASESDVLTNQKFAKQTVLLDVHC